jgi:hypothetical protein
MKYLADANVLSEPTNPHPNAAVIEWLRHHEPELVVSPIVLGELQYGGKPWHSSFDVKPHSKSGSHDHILIKILFLYIQLQMYHRAYSTNTLVINSAFTSPSQPNRAMEKGRIQRSTTWAPPTWQKR